MAEAEIGVTQRRWKKGLSGVKVVTAGKRGGRHQSKAFFGSVQV